MTDRQAIKYFLIVFLIASAIFLLRFKITGLGIYGDGIDYYVYARSLFFDRDLDFANEFTFYKERGQDIRNTTLSMRTPTGYVNVPSPVGCSLLWFPFLLAAHGLVGILNLSGFNIEANGYSGLYELIIGIGNIFFGFISLYLIYKIAGRFFEKRVSFLASLSIFLSTSGLYYFAFEPIRSHMPSLLMISLFVYFWLRTYHKRSLQQWSLLGFLMGLLVMIRTQEATFLLLIFTELILKLKQHRFNRLAFLTGGVLIFALISILTYLPQLIVQKIIWGSFFANPYALMTGKRMFYWFRPQLINSLLSTNHGLFLWFPLTLVAFMGFLRWKSKRLIWWPLLISFLSQYYLLASYESWWQSAGFGPRMFISSNPFFSLGLASLVDKMRKKISFRLITIILAIFIVWNFLLLGQFLLKMIPNDREFELLIFVKTQFLLPYLIINRLQNNFQFSIFNFQ